MARKLKAVYFNDDTEEDLLKFAKDLPNFSDWVKSCIRRELQSRETGVDPGLEDLVERIIETKLAGRTVLDPAPQEKKADEEINISSDLEKFF